MSSRDGEGHRTMTLADARWCGPHGIGRYAEEVLARLKKSGARVLELRGPPPLHPLEPLWLSWKVAHLRPDVYYSPSFDPPLWSAAPVVFTIHDLIHLSNHADYGWRQRVYYERVVRPAVRRAAAVMTVSEFSKGEILKWSGVPESKLVVTGAGVGEEFEPGVEPLRLPYEYLLYVGNRKPHKNIAGLLRAFAKVPKRHHAQLVLTGDEDRETSLLARSLGIDGRVTFMGHVDARALPRLYRGAVALVFPSLVEGFGLPPLEAMACGTPVITSDAASIPEVVGDAGVMVDARDVDALAEAMDQILDDERLREDLSGRGIRRARLFSWDAVARRVLLTLRGVAEGGTGR